MNDSTRSLGRMLELDLERIGMLQKDLVTKLTDEGEPSLSEQALSNWKRSGTVPRRRLDKLLDILGPNSLIAQAHKDGKFVQGKTAATMQYIGDPHFDTSVTNWAYKAELVTPRRVPRNVVRPSTMMRFSVSEMAVKAALPADHQLYFDQELIFGAMVLRMDYISPRVVAEITRAAGNAMNAHIYRPLWRLALARKVANDDRVYGLLMVMPPSDERDDEALLKNERYNRRLMLEADLMGLRMRIAEDANEAAKILQIWGEPTYEEMDTDF